MSVKKRNISFNSANGEDTVVGYFYTDEAVRPHAVVQLSHGMCEYIGRYDDFAAYLCARGSVSYTHLDVYKRQFKWITNLSGSQGYVIVSATNPQDVRYVDSHRIKIQPGAYLFDGLSFYARFFGAPFTGLTDYSFELDDEGNPYWVISTYRNTWGFRLPEATGALIINAETGARQKYTLSNLPEWVDRVQPEDFIIQQIDNRCV